MKEGMIKNPYRGKLICLEGIDGSGKSEQYRKLHNKLILRSSLNVVFTKAPTNSEIGREIYDILNDQHPVLKLAELSELEMQRKYFYDHCGHYQDLILPCLRAGVNVISDRGPASVAYGIKNETEFNHFLSVEKAMFYNRKVLFVCPDLIVIYDVPVDVALDRSRQKQRKLDKFEQKAMLEKTRENYLNIIATKIPNCVVVNGVPSIETVFEETKKHVFGVLKIKS